MADQFAMMNVSLSLLIVFLGLSIVDGVYVHLVRFRLPENPGSRFEHMLHTTRALLFVPTVFLLYVTNTSGMLLWAAALLVLFDFYVQCVDVLEERRSRLRVGGLTSGEYLLHVIEAVVHFSAFTLVFAAKPLAAWSDTINLPEFPEHLSAIGAVITMGGICISVLHLVLIPYPFFVSKVLGARGRRLS